MVQLEPNVTLTLKHLAASGAVISAEQQAALDHSLPIKRIEAGLKTLTLWGRIFARNGKDYLIAEGYNDAYVKNDEIVFDTKYYYSQDGVKWYDLLEADAVTVKRCGKIRSSFTGDPSFVTPVTEPNPEAKGAAADDEEIPKTLTFEVSELQRMWASIQQINSATNVVPKDYYILDARNHLTVNKMFPGVEFPDKLEAYVHRTSSTATRTLADDVRGCWSLQHDPFKSVTILRNLVFPGYSFYFNAYDQTWGSLYVGDGLRNNDLVFML